MIRHAATLLFGLVALAGIYVLLLNLPHLMGGWFGLLGVLVLAVMPGYLNFPWLVAISGIAIFGIYRKLPGLTVAPLLFFAAWYCASVWNRHEFARDLDQSLASRPVPAELRSTRTLTIVGPGQPCCGSITLLVDHTIDSFVHAQTDKQGRVAAIHATQLAATKDCDADELLRSSQLRSSGRTNQCLKTTILAAIPDGLVIRTQPAEPLLGDGCCNSGTISIRQDGDERVAATWRYGRQTVLSYLPFLGNNPHPTPLWTYASVGPRQSIQVGGPAFSGEDLAAAVYGIDWKAPLKFVETSNVELSQRAQQLALTKNPFPALDIALQVQGSGYVDDELIGVAARFVQCCDDQKLYKFWARLNRDEKRKFVEDIIALISNPISDGSDHTQARFQIRMHREELTAYMPQAEAIFATRRDLQIWQYEMALRLAHDDQLRLGSENYLSEQQRRFRLVQDDASDAFTRRAIAFKRVYFFRRDEEREFFAHQLDRVPDKLLHDYLTAAGWNRNPDEKSVTTATSLLRQLAAVRIAAVPDEKLRRDLQEWFREFAGR
ncbi:hypothetical protein [Bradyrhizobium sp. CCGB20]|uniref:hypothetical protein n=1 Tax=Bradyrhizobium sp. CCGB20 TaxID=2949633 RepID=UPI0020B3A808|nr:hypothetical protein [Bradyrhizobium sp. CCGB20]MCP3400813.1 hypothetical protein [Bradyrhizobium sp. CCGB20]